MEENKIKMKSIHLKLEETQFQNLVNKKLAMNVERQKLLSWEEFVILLAQNA